MTASRANAPKSPPSPLVSVIVAVYNGDRFIAGALRSILAQTYENFEILVVDDGSTDGTPSELSRFSDRRLRVFNRRNCGAAASRNFGASQSHGTYLAFLDADDRWLPEKLAIEVATILSKPDTVGMLYSWYYAVDDQGRLFRTSPRYSFEGYILDALLAHDNFIIPSVTLLHRDVFAAVGGYSDRRIHEDQELVLRVAACFPVYATRRRLAVYRQSLSGKGRAVLWDFEAAYQAQMGIVDALRTVLSDDQSATLRVTMLRSLLYRFLMYGFMDSAKRLRPLIHLGPLWRSKKGIVAVVSLASGVNLLMWGRRLIQALGAFMPTVGLRRVLVELYRAPSLEGRPRVVFVSDHLPGYQIGLERSGAGIYLRAIAERFRSSGYEVVWILVRPRVNFMSINREAFPYRLVSRSVRSVGSNYVIVDPGGATAAFAYLIYRRLSGVLRRVVANLRATSRAWRGFDHVIGRPMAAGDAAFVTRSVTTEGPDVVLFDTIFNVCPVRAPSQWIVSHDVKYQRHASLVASGVKVLPVRFDRDRERQIIESVGSVIAIQCDEAAEFKRLAPGVRVATVPMPLDIPISRAQAVPASGRCLFVGSAAYPNVQGLAWFLSECWPAIRHRVPNASLDVCGTVCDRFDHAYEGVRFRGVVDSLDAEYGSAAVVVVPLLVGSGLKIKLVEAMAYGRPCVTTPIGAQGLTEILPAPFVVAADAQRFAEQTVLILDDEGFSEELGRRALEAARAFRPDQAFLALEAGIATDLLAKTAYHSEAPVVAGAAASGSSAKPPAKDGVRVCIAIPTYRRPSLLCRLLDGLARQIGIPDATGIRVVVLDNDSGKSAYDVVNSRLDSFPYPLAYEAVPEPGLCSVRNAALAYAAGKANFIVMIDDDQSPEPRWLSELLAVQNDLGADAVIGPVPQILPKDAPRWIHRGGFFAAPVRRDRTLCDDGHSGNCLLSTATVARLGLSFDPTCNFAGGEDQLFFRQMHARGGRIAYAASASAPETVLPDRLSAAYLVRRSLRRGNSLWICDAKIHGTFRVMSLRVAKGLAHVGIGLVLAGPRAARLGKAGVVTSMCEIARGVGMLAGIFGVVVLEYGRDTGTRPRDVAALNAAGEQRAAAS